MRDVAACRKDDGSAALKVSLQCGQRSSEGGREERRPAFYTLRSIASRQVAYISHLGAHTPVAHQNAQLLQVQQAWCLPGHAGAVCEVAVHAVSIQGKNFASSRNNTARAICFYISFWAWAAWSMDESAYETRSLGSVPAQQLSLVPTIPGPRTGDAACDTTMKKMCKHVVRKHWPRLVLDSNGLRVGDDRHACLCLQPILQGFHLIHQPLIQVWQDCLYC